VEADVFLLTDEEPDLLAGGPGLILDRSEPASSSLLDDLRSDVGMEWMPEEMWFTYLQVDAEARELDYDLAASVTPDTLPSLADTGVEAPEAREIAAPDPGRGLWPITAGVLAAGVVLGLLVRRDGGARRDGIAFR
jgi:hypothetical protein